MVDTLSDILVAFGWPGFIIFLLICGAIYLLGFFIKKNNDKTSKSINEGFSKMTDSMSCQNEKLMNAILDQNAKNNEILSKLIYSTLEQRDKDRENKHNASIQQRIDVSKIIQTKVHDLLNKYSADRAFILEFHNSKQNMSGLSFLWYDMVYEEVAKGKPVINVEYKDQDISALLPIIEDINENGGYKIFYRGDLDNMYEKSSVMYYRLRVERQLDEAIMVGLYSEKNRLLGILILEYENDLIPVETIDLEDIISQSAAIATLLDYDA